MASFKAREVKKGMFEIQGLEKFIEARFAEIKRALKTGLSGAKKAVKQTRATVTRVKPRPTPIKPAANGKEPLKRVLAALSKHPRRDELVRAGKQKDQLLRSLIPLYVARSLDVDVTSGIMSDFWRFNGVKYLAPNAAKALREHVGYARQTKGGRQITPNGIKYVESKLAIAKKRAA